MKSEQEIRERIERYEQVKNRNSRKSVEWVQADVKVHQLKWVLGELDNDV